MSPGQDTLQAHWDESREISMVQALACRQESRRLYPSLARTVNEYALPSGIVLTGRVIVDGLSPEALPAGLQR